MPDGAFIVCRDTDNPRDIHFQLKKGVKSESVPKDQSTLRVEVDSALTILRSIFPKGDNRFEEYFKPLLSLAQLGLASKPAFTELAHSALIGLKEDIVSRESGGIKNQHMKKLGIDALWLSGAPLLVGLGLYYRSTEYHPLYSFFFLWVGCMAGVWLSFGTRRSFMRFKDLYVPEEDALEPFVRLLFSGLLTITVGLFFSTGIVKVELGDISTLQFNDSVQIALLIGILSGFSEKVLPSKIARQASSLFDVADK